MKKEVKNALIMGMFLVAAGASYAIWVSMNAQGEAERLRKKVEGSSSGSGSENGDS